MNLNDIKVSDIYYVHLSRYGDSLEISISTEDTSKLGSHKRQSWCIDPDLYDVVVEKICSLGLVRVAALSGDLHVVFSKPSLALHFDYLLETNR